MTSGPGPEAQMISGVNPTLDTALSLWRAAATSQAAATTTAKASTSNNAADPRLSAQPQIDAIFAILKAAQAQNQAAAAPTTAATSSSAATADLAKLIAGQLGTTAQAAQAAEREAGAIAAGNDGGGPDAALVLKAGNGTVAAAIAVHGVYNMLPGASERLKEMQEEALTFVANNSLSAKTISDILYHGGSLSTASGTTADTFASQMNIMNDSAEGIQNEASAIAKWVLDGQPQDSRYAEAFAGRSKAEITLLTTNMMAQAAQEAGEAALMSAAFLNHTLTFEKAIDVKGLDYQSTSWSSNIVWCGSASGYGSVNQDFLRHSPDGKNHEILDFNGAAMYLTF